MSDASKSSFVIALDGPAASGKGTLSRMIAAHYDFAHLDTGVLYRGVAWLMLQSDRDPADVAEAAKTAQAFTLSQIEGALIRTKEVGAAASVVAANKEVRAALLNFQRNFAVSPPPLNGDTPRPAKGAVLDGRDIGTVICPDAPLKFFVTASPQVRAHRRWKELLPSRPGLLEADILAELKERDARDAAREDAPMVAAADAELLDTTGLTIDGAFAAACRIIDNAFLRWQRDGEQAVSG